MNKTKIEWCDYTINPVKGLCPVGCSYCYARRMYKRFGWNPEIRYTDPGFTIAELQKIKKPSRIFWGSTMELFWDWPGIWLKDTFKIIKQFPQHTHIFLTKRPENLVKWSPFPDNCWVGVSVVDDSIFTRAWKGLKDVNATVKFISFEPLLNWDMSLEDTKWTLNTAGVNWLIVGQQTPEKLSTMPKVGWVEDIVQAADLAHVPVFLKNNLISCVDQYPFAFSGVWPDIKLRQEFPVLTPPEKKE